LTGVYVTGCASLEQPRLTEEQEQAQRAGISIQKPAALPAPEPVRKRRPLTSPANSDDEGMSEDQRRCADLGKKMAERAAKALKPPPRSPSTPEVKNPAMKAAASQKAPAESKPTTGAKAPKPAKGQESPEAKASHPMATRTRNASRAGGLRSGGGSGQTDTCVAQGNPSKT
jgi:hypothetical protein